MRSFLGLLQSLGSAGATYNARAELDLAESRRHQAAVVARRIDTIDAVASGREVALPSRPTVVAIAA